MLKIFWSIYADYLKNDVDDDDAQGVMLMKNQKVKAVAMMMKRGTG